MSSSTNDSLAIQKIQHDPQLGQLYKICFVNILFSIFTLGIHRFWGITRLRKYLVRCSMLQNDRFEYTGKGIELFRGFVKVMGVFMALSGLYFGVGYLIQHVLNMPFLMKIIDVVLAIAYVPTLFFLIYTGAYGALRYRLTKTRWRGIRFNLSGSAFSFGLFAMKRVFLNIISLGILIPTSALKKESLLINNMSYGSLKFTMNYPTHHLNKVNIVTLLLAIPTLTFSRIWYHVALRKFIYENIQLQDIRFRFTMTPGCQILLDIKAFLLLMITVGLGYPIVLQMYIKTFLDNVEINLGTLTFNL